MCTVHPPPEDGSIYILTYLGIIDRSSLAARVYIVSTLAKLWRAEDCTNPLSSVLFVNFSYFLKLNLYIILYHKPSFLK